MSIDSYVGTEGITINVENSTELYHAIDILHSQLIDNVGASYSRSQLLDVLSRAMDELTIVYDSIDADGC